MNQQTNVLSKIVFIVSLIIMALTACRKDEIISDGKSAYTPVNSDRAPGNSAKAHIAASEKLEIPASVSVPENFPNGNTRVATYYAVGVQKYKAQTKAGSLPVTYEWVFVAPRAELYDVTNSKVGTHGAGPYWEISSFDSIFAQQFSPARTATSPDPESIDWLLLKPKTGTTPTGIFADVDYIQRIATKGGKAPETPPTSPTETTEVKYKAVYRFTKINQ